MSPQKAVAILVFGEELSGRNALTEEKYTRLAAALDESGFVVASVLHHPSSLPSLFQRLREFDAVLVWVNPVEQGENRKDLDDVLTRLSSAGRYVSAHPETIAKIGTKEVLFNTRAMSWGGDVRRYGGFDEFQRLFPASLEESGTRVLKHCRGNGGNGVFKVSLSDDGHRTVRVRHALTVTETVHSFDALFDEWKNYFSDGGILIDQPWHENIANGMVRCYCTGAIVSGFGYQEVNALFPPVDASALPPSPSKRFYFTEQCGLFQDLRNVMERNWIPQLIDRCAVDRKMMPLVWDADFFINTVNEHEAEKKYTLCEINASCVSPFPESAVPHIVQHLKQIVLP